MSYADLRELNNALRTANDIASHSWEGTPPMDQLDALSDALQRALTSVRAMESELGGSTGCREHPRGAVDPLYGDRDDPLPPGWGKCLLCNDRRRKAGSARGRRYR
ncbi:hypothetical protein JGS22_001165 [Streptomyces sp. P38-E01]|uniref:Uncharacterized protein n=1 Tax=Streptomyces tardus TaxID=2780544 RepID=A0A949JJG8_9ACTN|nr:hypothetical protein [Streptomyces tardus]MBU7596281.1 hypothetical protein [Streptomyces tardus]